MLKRVRLPGTIHFHISVVAAVLVIVIVMTGSTVGMILSAAKKSAQKVASDQFDVICQSVSERTDLLLSPAIELVQVLALMPGINTDSENDGLSNPARELFSLILNTNSSFYSGYLGYSSGDFFQVIKAGKNQRIVDAHEAPSSTDIIIRNIAGEDGSRQQSYTFLDESGAVLGNRTESDFDYDPRKRVWYTDALKTDDVILSRPYIFNSLKYPGITVAFAVPGNRGVVGIDLTISSLVDFILSQKISPNGGLALLTEEFDVIASTPGMDSFLEQAKSGYLLSDEPVSGTIMKDDGDRLVQIQKLRINADTDLVIFYSAPLSDYMTSAMDLQKKILRISFLILLITVPFVFFWSKQLSHALIELTSDAEKIAGMDFSGELSIRTNVYEFNKLSQGFGIMKSTIADRTGKLNETLVKLELLVDMGIAMSSEFNIDRLSEMILTGAKDLTHAEGGSLYLLNKEKDHLEFKIVLNDALDFKQGGTSGVPVSMKPVRLYEEDGKENHHNVVTHTFHTGKTVNIADAYQIGEYDFSGTRIFDSENNYRSVSFLTVPLKPRGGGAILGALQLINAREPSTGEIIPFPESWQSFVEALSSAAAVAVQNWNLMEEQKLLFDNLVRFVASAIDTKSPYTARHCERVPVIANILLREANKSGKGIFSDFRIDSPAQIREFNVASWLHDCGKVTTPEYVVDKATKLETIYNRIHEIRTRFEVLLRDAMIDRYKKVLDGMDPEQADREFSLAESTLHNDFRFVAECNVGSEFMEDAKLQRLKKLAEIKWLRYFDNRIGLSWGEEQRLADLSKGESRPIPAEENLLDDNPMHLIPRENRIWGNDGKFGFAMDVPEYLYNRGELYNLSVRNGTLTPEERFKINEHVIQTIVMLEHLPFPDDLKKVPDFAGKHHEVPDGSGYPRGITDSRLSLADRIIAFADIFEALTSTDRPYKKENTISGAIDILYTMKEEGKVDPDLFDLLLSSGVYKEYAREFMKPSQIDDVDVDRYLSGRK